MPFQKNNTLWKKRRTLSGVDNPNWRGGITLKTKKCMECKKELKDYRAKRCKECNYIFAKNNGGTFGGKHHSKNTQTKMRKIKMGHLVSSKTRKKLRTFNLGKHHTNKTKKKMSEARKGENNPNWKGGMSLKPYSVDWTETLRKSIRERDKYTCQLCNKSQGDRALSVHHIDYNKKNNNPKNLIALCLKCHLKTNFNRKHWTNYFKGREYS